MTASITGRKRCTCAQYFAPLANGTMPRHTRPTRAALGELGPKRVRCENTGKFPPSTVRGGQPQIGDRPTKKPRGGHRAAKRDAALKARYRRNAAGGYNR